MVISPEKHVLLRANVLEMNSKSLQVDGAEESRLLRGVSCSPRASSHSSHNCTEAHVAATAAC